MPLNNPNTGVVPSARVTNDADQTITTSTWTALTFNTESYDNDGMHSTSSNTSRLTCVTAGKYHINGFATFTSNATGSRALELLHNGTTIIAQHSSNTISGVDSRLTIAADFQLAQGDYVELRVWQNSGGDLAVKSITGRGFFLAAHKFSN